MTKKTDNDRLNVWKASKQEENILDPCNCAFVNSPQFSQVHNSIEEPWKVILQKIKDLRTSVNDLKENPGTSSLGSLQKELAKEVGSNPPVRSGFVRPEEAHMDPTLAKLAFSQKRFTKEVDPEALSIMLGGGGFQPPLPATCLGVRLRSK